MPVGIIDHLEVVQIEHVKCVSFSISGHLQVNLIKPIHKQGPVRESCQRIMERVIARQLLLPLINQASPCTNNCQYERHDADQDQRSYVLPDIIENTRIELPVAVHHHEKKIRLRPDKHTFIGNIVI